MGRKQEEIEKPEQIVLKEYDNGLTVGDLNYLTKSIATALSYLAEKNPDLFTYVDERSLFDRYTLKPNEGELFLIEILEDLYRQIRIEHQKLVIGSAGQMILERRKMVLKSMGKNNTAAEVPFNMGMSVGLDAYNNRDDERLFFDFSPLEVAPGHTTRGVRLGNEKDPMFILFNSFIDILNAYLATTEDMKE